MDSVIEREARVIENVRIVMRDGVLLVADVYLPAGEGPWPALVERTPYGRRLANHADRTRADPAPRSKPEVARDFTRFGYAYVMQDVRGRYESGGTFEKYVNESDDGVDTLAWVRAQPWCDGRIGTLGLSYGAHVQAALAVHAPPGLSGMILDSGGFSSAYHSGIRQGGAFELKQLTWALKHARLAYADDPARSAMLASADIFEWIGVNPWTETNTPLAAAPTYARYIADQWRRECLDAGWRVPGLSLRGRYDRFAHIPALFISSWYDPYARSATENFAALVALGRAQPALIMGPWTHGQRSVTYSGAVDFGVEATLDGNIAEDYSALRHAWFERHLKQSAEIDPLPAPVSVFVMGGGSGRRSPDGRLDHGGHWLFSTAWPPPDAHPSTLFLGGVSLAAGPGEADSRSFDADPGNPVPTIGGAIASGAPVMAAGAFDQRPEFAHIAVADPRPLHLRDDVLVYETAPLDAAVEVVGPVSATLYVGTDGPDADLVLHLVDVYPPSDDWPDGFAMNITHGIQRLRFRNGYDSATMMAPGEIAEVNVELFPTANRFERGHRLRLHVSGSSFPHFDVNPNTGAASGEPSVPRVARTAVYSGPAHPSRLNLRVRPA